MSGEYNWKEMNEDLLAVLRLKTLPTAVKFYDRLEDAKRETGLEPYPFQCVPCSAVGRSTKLGAPTLVTSDNFIHNYCRGVNGFFERDEKWWSAAPFTDRWNATAEAAQAHHKALPQTPKKEAFVSAPMAMGLLEQPDAIAFYVLPEQGFWLMAGSINENYEKLDFTFVGESTCSDSWIRTAMTGKTSIGIGSFGERMQGMSQEEFCVSMTPATLKKAIEGMKTMKYGRSGLCFPIPNYTMLGDISSFVDPAFVGY